MPRIRVLVVDDSVVIRKIVSDALAADPDIEVVGTAANGKIALSKIVQCNPDLVTLDIEMPEMDGLTCIAEIRKTHPRLPVIMFSTLTERGATATLEALSRGASDYVTKPTASTGGSVEARSRVQADLVPKIKTLVRHETQPAAKPQPSAKSAPIRVAPRREQAAGRVEILVIGVSTGGPNALAELMPTLPKNLPVPVVIVQHMPPLFTRLLADRLDTRSELTIREAHEGAVLAPGEAWVAPGDFHVELVREGMKVKIHLQQEAPENSCRPAVDVLFRSAAKVYGGACLATVLTGMGQDGLRGCEHIAERGGQIVVQDEASSVVWGMPGFVAKAGLAEKVLPLAGIGPELVSRIFQGRAAARSVPLAATR